MALTQEQVTLISVAAFGVAPGEVHSKYFLDSDAAGKFFVGGTDKQIHEVLGLKEPLTGTAAVAAVLEHEYNHLVFITDGLEKVSNAEFVKNVTKNLGAEDSKTLAVDLASGMSRYEALAKFAQAEAEKAGGIEKVAGIITALENDKTIDNAAKDLIASAAKPDTPNKPEVDGEEIFLTEGRDKVTGTADNDWFIADAGQNSLGMITNALSTGDHLDGGAGTDTLEVTLVADESFNSAMAVRPITESIENVFINALAQDFSPFTNNSSTIVNSTTRLNADKMSDLEQIWSNGSEGSLRVENVGNPGNTDALTIGMRSTGNAGSIANRNESNYEVYFQEQELEAGKNDGVEALSFNMLDQTAYDNKENPLKGFALDGLSFKLDGKDYSLKFDNAIDDTPDTYAGLAAALNILLAKEAPALVAQGVKFEEGNSFTDPDGRLGTTINLTIPSTDSATPRLDFKNAETPYTSVEFGSSPSNNIYRQAQELDTTAPTGLPVTSNIILDDVGRGSAGGSLTVGSMSQISKTSTGVEDFNLKVQNSSSLSGLFTTNTDAGKDFAKKAKSIFITSDTDATGNLKIGNENSTGKVVEDNLKIIKTNGFKGDLSLGTADYRFVNTGRLDAVIEGKVTFNALVDNPNNDSTVYSYKTGSGADTVDVILNTDTIDRVDTGLTIDTGAGADNIRLDSKTLVNEDDASQLTYASQLTMYKLDKIKAKAGSGDDSVVKVNAGIGDDFVKVVGDVRANIDAGAGSDFVVINSNGAAQDIKDATKDANGGSWDFGLASASQQGAGFAPKVLYKAELTVTFAGFEGKAPVPTDAAGNFVADQLVINQAIRDAIAAEKSPELARLLKVTNKDGSQQITVDSTVAGANVLTVKINQPNAVVANADTGQVQVSTGDLLALQKGLIATTAGSNSDTFNSIDAVATAIIGGTDTVPANTVVKGGTATESNFSVINMGGGVNDLLVLDSNLESSNIIEINEDFGKVSVVNFHNANNNTGTGVVGKHAIDFTSILDNEADSSANDNNLSKKDVAITLNTTGGSAVANSVNMLRFQEDLGNTAAINWAGLNETNLVAALNGTGTPAVLGNGGISAATLNAGNFNPATGTLIGNTQKHIVMVENIDNLGEYKVFRLTSTVDTDGITVTNNLFDTNTAQLLGTMDFGASINFNLVGQEGWDAKFKGYLATADGIVPTEAPSEEPTEEPTDPEVPGTNPVAIDVVPTDGTFADTFAGTEAADVFTVNAVEADLVNLAAEITITNFGANDSLSFKGAYAAGMSNTVLGALGVGQPVDISMDGTNLQVILMDSPTVDDIDTWIVTFEDVDASIADMVNGAADTQVALAGLNDAWNAEWLVLA